MRIVFDQDKQVEFALSGPVTSSLERMYKHLQYVPLNWRDWDNPYYIVESPVKKLVNCGKKLGIEVDEKRSNDQSYLNYLHRRYELEYDGRSEWLDFNEYIHRCEREKKQKTLSFDHREHAGLVQKPFNYSWLENSVSKVKKGKLFVKWNELGKKPFEYWLDNESVDISSMCATAKPWITLRSRIDLALEDTDFAPDIDQQSFDIWWQTYKKDWCEHWKLASWELEQQISVIPIGQLDEAQCDLVVEWLNQGLKPTHVRL